MHINQPKLVYDTYLFIESIILWRFPAGIRSVVIFLSRAISSVSWGGSRILKKLGRKIFLQFHATMWRFRRIIFMLPSSSSKLEHRDSKPLPCQHHVYIRRPKVASFCLMYRSMIDCHLRDTISSLVCYGRNVNCNIFLKNVAKY